MSGRELSWLEFSEEINFIYPHPISMFFTVNPDQLQDGFCSYNSGILWYNKRPLSRSGEMADTGDLKSLAR